MRIFLLFTCCLSTVLSQHPLHQGPNPHLPTSSSPPHHPFGAPQFPRFNRCGSTEPGSEGADSQQWDWLHREYGCASLFASISVLSRGQPSALTPHSTTTQPATPSVEPVPDMSPKKAGGDPTQPMPHRPENTRSSNKHGDQVTRHRAHRGGGGLFAGVGLSPDFYSGGFGRYPRVGDAVEQDPLSWRHGTVQDSSDGQVQRDALEDMTNERRKKDAQTCAEFRSLGAKVVNWGPLEKVCCNVMCYCDDIQNVTGHDRCGGLDPAPPQAPSSTQRPKTAVKNPPAIHPPDPPTVDQSTGHIPETVGSPNQHQLTEQPEPNTNVPPTEKLIISSAAHSSTRATRATTPATPASSTLGSRPSKSATTSTTADPIHITDSTIFTDVPPTDPLVPPSKKGPDAPPLAGVAAAALAADKAAPRPLWAPISNNMDNPHQPVAHRKEQFGAPSEWGNVVLGDQVNRQQ